MLLVSYTEGSALINRASHVLIRKSQRFLVQATDDDDVGSGQILASAKNTEDGHGDPR